jgi:hypothetical protein
MENKTREIHICEYGCGQEAIYQLKNGKWCCSKSWNSCACLKIKNSYRNKGRIPSNKGKKHSIETRQRISNSRKGKKYKKDIIREKPEFCDYGCGQKAEFYFKGSDTWCCSSRWNKCPKKREKVSNHLKKENVVKE